ncbi:MAG: hypothetical protein A4S16_01600 [Proteobacteria bacterium SG_bin6]|nr:MAG: hypothetical protein A4S16_01600 [Proteobacteria bacterium SG_bin6]
MARADTPGSGWAAPALLIGGMALFGSATPVSKLVGAAFPPMLAGLMRVGIGSALLMLAAREHWRDIPGIKRGDWLRLALIALFGMFGFSALMLYGMRLASGVAGATIMAMTPAVTAAGAMLFFGEKPSWRKIAALCAAVGGALLLELGRAGGGGDPGALSGALLIFAAICCEAAYTLIGQRVSKVIDPVLAAGLGALLALPLFAVAALVTGQLGPPRADGTGWAALLFYAAGTLALGSWLWYRGIAQVSGVVAATFMGVMPLTALVLSYWLLGEPFRWIHLGGFVIVFAGVLLMSWEHARAATAA